MEGHNLIENFRPPCLGTRTLVRVLANKSRCWVPHSPHGHLMPRLPLHPSMSRKSEKYKRAAFYLLPMWSVMAATYTSGINCDRYKEESRTELGEHIVSQDTLVDEQIEVSGFEHLPH